MVRQVAEKKYSKMFIAKRVRFTMWEEEQVVHSDAKWLGYIVDQITSYALKFLDDEGSIACSFEVDSQEKRLLIRDTGVGIKPEDIGRIFEKGFTGSNGRQFAKSTAWDCEPSTTMPPPGLWAVARLS